MPAQPGEVAFGQRVVARTLDGVVAATVAWAAATVLGAVDTPLVSIAAAVIYEGLATQLFGTTLGKLALGIRVTTADDAPVSGARAALRFAVLAGGAAIPAALGAPDLIGTGWVLAMGIPAMFAPSHRGVHDRVTGTSVAATADSQRSSTEL